MKEMLKSKGMICFLCMIIGFFYLNAKDIQKMEVMDCHETDIYIAMNA